MMKMILWLAFLAIVAVSLTVGIISVLPPRDAMTECVNPQTVMQPMPLPDGSMAITSSTTCN